MTTLNNSQNNLQHRLTRYSLAAGAVGLVAEAHQANAAIQLYDNGGAGWTINDNQDLFFTYTGNTTTVDPGSGFQLVNNPGIASFKGAWTGAYRRIYAQGASDRVIEGPLASGAAIPGTGAQQAGFSMTYSGTGNLGFPMPGTAYLGLIFDVSGDKYYGWMDITLDAYVEGGGDTILVNRFAVEDAANTPITAGATGSSSAVPEPGTLALLVLGATGLAALRRREG